MIEEGRSSQSNFLYVVFGPSANLWSDTDTNIYTGTYCLAYAVCGVFVITFLALVLLVGAVNKAALEQNAQDSKAVSDSSKVPDKAIEADTKV